MDHDSFSAQGTRIGEDVMIEFFFERGPLMAMPPVELEVCSGDNRTVQLAPCWKRAETVYARTRNYGTWDSVVPLLNGPNGNLVSGEYHVIFVSYRNTTREYEFGDLSELAGIPLVGTITVENSGSDYTAQCSLPADAVVRLLVDSIARAWMHKDLRFSDRVLQLHDMLKFIDIETYIAVADRLARITDKLFSVLDLNEPAIRPSFRHMPDRFNISAFQQKFRKPQSLVRHVELRKWLCVEHETLNGWLAQAGLKSPKQHGRTCEWTIADIEAHLIPFLQKHADTSPVGTKIHKALREVNRSK